VLVFVGPPPEGGGLGIHTAFFFRRAAEKVFFVKDPRRGWPPRGDFPSAVGNTSAALNPRRERALEDALTKSWEPFLGKI